MDFTVSSRAPKPACPPTLRRPTRARLTQSPHPSDLPRALLRDPRSDIHHLYPGLDFPLRLLQPMRYAAF
jgi:hypothetical protein